MPDPVPASAPPSPPPRPEGRAGRARSAGLASALLGAAFLMATSAVGPGFLTQTAVFTAQLGASCAFVILASILFDLGAQLNIWPVIAVSGRRAQDIANTLLPGLGHLLAALVALGGLAFNVGNIAGAGLGMNVMFGIPVATGALISAILALGLFLVKEAGRAMDRFALVMGFVMIALTCYVAVASHPPVAEAALRSVAPTRLSAFAIVTLVGGTVGGYITFAGAHRLIDAGVSGPDSARRATASAGTAIGVASVMRVVLFLAALGVVAKGLTLDPKNPPAAVFRLATGNVGYRLFGVVMWAAAMTSVVGAAYTSVSFLRGLAGVIDRQWTRAVIVFIVVSTAVFLFVGRPVRVLVLVGALNGLILPISLGVMLVAAHRRSIVGDYKHPWWLTIAGAVVAVSMMVLGGWTLVTQLPKVVH
ncbi:MAG TPA: NRAMP family divalent metal transporter [Gemmatimonadaceae bacterium]|nr:NRAMP family divalent metal transporter [Gemmatimonadaceae bacterium]